MAKGHEAPVQPGLSEEIFAQAFRIEHRFGTCVGVYLPVVSSTNPEVLRHLLHPKERALSRSMKGPRLVEWVGGRLASRSARAGMKGAGSPTLTGLNGAPEVGGGLKISISHTQTLSVALASADANYGIGVDVEAAVRNIRGESLLAERILSPAERDGLANGPQFDTLQRLSIKEAVYKAISALTGEPLPLRQISVSRVGHGGDQLRILVPIAALRIEAVSLNVAGHYLSLARASLPPRLA